MIARLRQETVLRLAGLPAFRRVFDTRQVQLRREMLPAVRVYTSATAENLSINIQQYRTTVQLVVQITAEDVTDPGNAELIDTLCLAVKARLLSDTTWLLLFERVLSIDTTLENNVEGESRTINATLTFALQESEVYDPVIPDWLEDVRLNVDVFRPAADPNVQYPGPDGRIEIAGAVTLPGNPKEE